MIVEDKRTIPGSLVIFQIVYYLYPHEFYKRFQGLRNERLRY